MFKPTKRNFKNVQFEKYRRKVDKKFNDLHDDLSDCYYNYWKKGESKPFQGYDVQSTLEESKVLFDKLHGLLFHLYEETLENEHEKTPDEEKDEKFTLKKTAEIESDQDKKQKRSKLISDLKKDGVEIKI